jgi:TolA-binding protein
MNKHVVALLLCLALLASGAAQVTAPSQPNLSATPAPASATMAVGLNLNDLLGQAEQAAQAATLDLARLRIEKWKTDSGMKQQMQQNSESLQRNLSAALPGMLSQVRSSPDSFAAAFKLYRNLQAVYDVFLPLSQAAEMFAPKPEVQALASDIDHFDRTRRAFADYLERMASVRDSELFRLRNQINVMQAGASKAPPKKIIVDNDEPKKPARKKKPAAKPSNGTNPQPQAPATPK